VQFRMQRRAVISRLSRTALRPSGRLSRLLLVLLALVPGVVVATAIFGPFGTDFELPRRIIFPNQSDVAMAFQAIEHMRTTPWSDGLLRASTFEGGVHITLVDGWPLFAMLVRLLDVSPDLLLAVVAFLTPPLAGLGGAMVANAMGARAPRQYFMASLVAAISAPVLFRLQPHLNVSQIWLVLFAIAAGLVLRTTDRPRRALAVGAASALAALFAYPYLGAGALLVLLGGIGDRWRSGRSTGRWSAAAVAVVAGLVAGGLWATGYLDGDLQAAGGGYELMGLNLLAPFLPIGCDICSPLPSLSPAPLWHEFNSFAFMGAGVLLALPIAALRLRGRWRRMLAERPGSALTLGAGLLYAIAPAIAIGPIVIYALTLPAWLPGYDIVQTFRNAALFAWPLLIVVAIGSVVVAVAPDQQRPKISEHRLRLLALVLTIVQVVGYAPLIDIAGGEFTKPVTVRPEMELLDDVIAGSNGVRITPPPNCRDAGAVNNGLGMPALYQELSGLVGAGTGQAGIPFYGARATRNATVNRCLPPSNEQLRGERAAGWSTIYLGPSTDGLIYPPVDTPCTALPGYLLCPADPSVLTNNPWIARVSLETEPFFGIPLLPLDGLEADDPRLESAMAMSPGRWTRHFRTEPDPEGAWQDLRDYEAYRPVGGEAGIWVDLAWPAASGNTLVLLYGPRAGADAPQWTTVDGVRRDERALYVSGNCTPQVCRGFTDLGLASGRIDLLGLRIAP